MEEQTLSAVLEALRKVQCITILDLESKEVETNLFFPTTSPPPLSLRTLKTKARGELYIFVVHEIASTFGFPSLERYPLPTHNSSFISSKLPSFPLSRLLVKIVGSLVSTKKFGIVLQLGFLQLSLACLVRSCYDNINLVLYPT
jgi:hypothetical protein